MKIEGKIKAVSRIRDVQDKKQVGFTLESNSDFWYNLSGSEEALNKLKNSILMKGNTIGFEYDKLGRTIKGLVLREKAKETETKSSNVIDIKGKDFVTYAGLLKKAHEKGLQSIEIIESWVSEDMKKAWCKVIAKFIKDKKEMFFDGFGSSTPENTGEMTQSHPVEMAHTRAKGRALRDYLNIGTAMIEELKEEEKK